MKFAKPTHSRKSVQLHSAEPDITAALLKDSQEISPSKPKTRRSQNDYSNDDSDESKSNEFSLRFLIMIRHFTILPVGILITSPNSRLSSISCIGLVTAVGPWSSGIRCLRPLLGLRWPHRSRRLRQLLRSHSIVTPVRWQRQC